MSDGLKVHLGCGRKVWDGWLNYDAKPWDERVIGWEACEQLRDRDGHVLRRETVDRIVAHDLIEHIPHSLNECVWFKFWEECWRVLKMGAEIEVLSPCGNSRWVWGDPGHTRAIQPETFAFLSAELYMKAREDEDNPMSMYEPCCNFDFRDRIAFTAREGASKPDTIIAKPTKLPLPEGYLAEKA